MSIYTVDTNKKKVDALLASNKASTDSLVKDVISDKGIRSYLINAFEEMVKERGPKGRIQQADLEGKGLGKLDKYASAVLRVTANFKNSEAMSHEVDIGAKKVVSKRTRKENASIKAIRQFYIDKNTPTSQRVLLDQDTSHKLDMGRVLLVLAIQAGAGYDFVSQRNSMTAIAKQYFGVHLSGDVVKPKNANPKNNSNGSSEETGSAGNTGSGPVDTTPENIDAMCDMVRGFLSRSKNQKSDIEALLKTLTNVKNNGSQLDPAKVSNG